MPRAFVTRVCAVCAHPFVTAKPTQTRCGRACYQRFQRETAARNGGWGSKSGKERRGWKIERCPCGSLVWRKGDETTGHECAAPVAVLRGA